MLTIADTMTYIMMCRTTKTCRHQGTLRHSLAVIVTVFVACLLQQAESRPTRHHQVVCPNGFVRYFRSCYKFSQMRASWVNAQTYCISIGASLVAIEDRHEMKYLVNYARQHKAFSWHLFGENKIRKLCCEIRELFRRSFWTGGNDIAAEGEWRWVGSLAPVTYTNWHIYQPDNGRLNEHCMELERAFQYQWNDQPCHLQNHFICEIIMY